MMRSHQAAQQQPDSSPAGQFSFVRHPAGNSADGNSLARESFTATHTDPYGRSPDSNIIIRTAISGVAIPSAAAAAECLDTADPQVCAVLILTSEYAFKIK